MENNLKKDDLVLVYINHSTNKCEIREMHKKPEETYAEHFITITDFLTGCTICNRLNSHLGILDWKTKGDKDKIDSLNNQLHNSQTELSESRTAYEKLEAEMNERWDRRGVVLDAAKPEGCSVTRVSGDQQRTIIIDTNAFLMEKVKKLCHDADATMNNMEENAFYVEIKIHEDLFEDFKTDLELCVKPDLSTAPIIKEL